MDEDVDAICALGGSAHPGHLEESHEAVASRLNAGRQTSFVLTSGGQTFGYVLAHPWDESVSPLGAVIEPRDGDVLFLHDIVVADEARGFGHARRAVSSLKTLAILNGWRMQIVCVNQSYPFWTRLGFTLAGHVDELDSYGTDALLMMWKPELSDGL
jgi:GNAT superfamily N-acetyltransferase